MKPDSLSRSMSGYPACIYVFLLVILGGCGSTSWVGSSGSVKESQSGILEGYLSLREIPNSLLILPAPPELGSPAYNADLKISQETLANRDSARWEQAIQDAILGYPEAIDVFSGILGLVFTVENTPELHLMLHRVLTDAVLSTYAAKKHYARVRPFMMNDQPSCKPEDEEDLRNDGSYPSGHTAIGWAWSLILCELFPEKTDALMARGREFGESRIICNVHWHSDVVAGRLVGAAVVARLHADPEFRSDLKAVKREISKLQRQMQ
jgi:acid phosphatase (class A)